MEVKADLKILVLAIILILLILGGFFLIWSVIILGITLSAIGVFIYGLIKAIIRIFRRKKI